MFQPLSIPPVDHRREQRHITVLIIGKVRGERGDYACVVNNVSCNGLKARFPHPPVIGERLSLAFRGVPELTGTVRWADGNQGGAEFDQPLDLGSILATYGAARMPRAPRFACHRTTSLILDGCDCPAELLDLSLGGAKLGFDAAVTNVVGRGGTLILPVTKAPRAGTIRWDDGVRVGFQFAVPLTIDTLAELLSTKDQ